MADAHNICDGVYFGLPAEVYHEVPRLSASGLQKILVSPATFWKGSWLDPDRPEPDEDATKAQILGKAYHTARLEPELFEGAYVRELDKSEFPKGTLFTGTEMGAELERLGLKKSGSVDEQADRIAEAYAAIPVDAGEELPRDAKPIYRLALREWEEARGGRISIPAKFYDDIVRDMERIRSSPKVAALLSEGAAEVSVFWTDDRGNKLKARLDYLTAEWWTDLKTFANPMGKPLPQLISDAIKYNRYHVQAAQYRDAVEAVRAGLPVIEGEDWQRELIEAVQLTEEMACWYVFVEKDDVPNILARQMRFHEVPLSTTINDAGASEEGIARMHALTRQPSLWFLRAQREIRKAKRLFRAYAEVYQPGEPWLPFEPLGDITDMDFSAYFLDEEIGE